MAKYIKYVLYLLCGFIILLTGACLYLLYMPFYFPKPTGEYAVGRCEYHWVDMSRLETRAQDSAHPHRELMVKAWYPVQMPATGIPVTPYAPALSDFDRKNSKKIDSVLLGTYRPIYAHYLPQAPIAISNKPFPVLIFSHGFGLPDDHYTAYCSELASHGYVVFSINHTYDCVFVDFPDGRRVLEIHSPESKPILEEEAWRDKHIETWVADVLFVLDQITKETQDSSSFLWSRLDLDHVGIFGHSFGGAAAVQCCRRDKRFAAGVNLDGGLKGANFAEEFKKPFMFMRAMAYIKWILKTMNKMFKPEEQAEAQKYLQERDLSGLNKLAKNMGPDAYIIDFENAYHNTFTDFEILKQASPFSCLFDYLGAGSANGFVITATINGYLVAFFDKYLKGIPTDILDPHRMSK